MKFTFVVFSYNNEEYIIETLESIKYQVKNYGNDYEITLIVIDDNSKDNSDELIKQWLYYNSKIFHSVEYIFNAENKGISHNFLYAMSSIGNENFKVIAGDDVFASKNIFKACNLMSKDTLKSYSVLELRDGKVFFDHNRMTLFFHNQSKAYSNNKLAKKIREGCFFHTPSTVFSKELYCKSRCEEEIAKFRNFEDDPMWYSMAKNSELDVAFINDYIVLYRIHNNSISTRPNKAFLEEQRKLKKIYLKDSKMLEKIKWWFFSHDDKSIIYFVEFYIKKVKRKLIQIYYEHNKNYKYYISDIISGVEKEQDYYNYIHEKAVDFVCNLKKRS